MTQNDVDRLYDTWHTHALSIDSFPKGSNSRNSAIVRANNAWRAFEEADDEVNGKPVGWHRQSNEPAA